MPRHTNPKRSIFTPNANLIVGRQPRGRARGLRMLGLAALAGSALLLSGCMSSPEGTYGRSYYGRSYYNARAYGYGYGPAYQTRYVYTPDVYNPYPNYNNLNDNAPFAVPTENSSSSGPSGTATAITVEPTQGLGQSASENSYYGGQSDRSYPSAIANGRTPYAGSTTVYSSTYYNSYPVPDYYQFPYWDSSIAFGLGYGFGYGYGYGYGGDDYFDDYAPYRDDGRPFRPGPVYPGTPTRPEPRPMFGGPLRGPDFGQAPLPQIEPYRRAGPLTFYHPLQGTYVRPPRSSFNTGGFNGGRQPLPHVQYAPPPPPPAQHAYAPPVGPISRPRFRQAGPLRIYAPNSGPGGPGNHPNPGGGQSFHPASPGPRPSGPPPSPPPAARAPSPPPSAPTRLGGPGNNK